MGRRVELALALVAASAAVLWMYRGAYDSVPRGDHLYMLWGRFLTDSDWGAFVESLDWNRTRSAGDGFLFRPALHGLPTAVLILSDGSLRALGLMNLALHALATWSLYGTLRIALRPMLAGLLSLLYAAQYPGIELVLWSTVSPYIGALVLFAAGTVLATSDSRWRGWAVLPLAAAGLFHDAATYALVVPGCVALLRRGNRSLGLVLLGGCGAYFAVDALDALRTMSQWKPAHDLPAGEGHGLVASLFLLCGAFTRALLAPASVDLVLSTPWGRATWDLTNQDDTLIALGIAPLLVIAVAGARWTWRAAREQADRIGWLQLLWLSHFLVFLVGVGALRIHERASVGVGYLSASTYYFGYLSFLAIGIAGLTWPRLPRVLRVVLAPIAAGLAILQIVLVRRMIATSFAWQVPVVAEITATLDRTLAGRADLCYGGVLDPKAATFQPPVWSFLLVEPELVCRGGDARIAVYLARDSVGWSLSSMSAAPARVADTVGKARDDRAIDLRDVAVTVPAGVAATLWLGVRGDDSLMVRLTSSDEVNTWVWEGGVAREIHVVQSMLLPGEPRTLRVVWAADRFWLLQGPRVFGPLVDLERLEGNVAVDVPPGTAVSWTIGEAAPAIAPVVRIALPSLDGLSFDD